VDAVNGKSICFCIQVVLNNKDGDKMSKKKNKEFKNNHALPKTDVEFANNGLEKVALKAQENNKK